MISLLKGSCIDYNNIELLVRKRLINLCGKKVGLLLQREEDE
jgi:hypothetical protein